MIWRPSPNFDDRDAEIDTLVLHYTGMQTGGDALDRLTDAASKVSAHYLVEENGDIFHLVKEDKRAWHAGVSSWRGATNLNARSIGVEIVNPGHEFGYEPFPPPQMEAVGVLAGEIVDRYSISPRNVVGHSDIAPLRKSDPGELFDWRGLAAKGIGLWYDDAVARDNGRKVSIAEYRHDLEEIGFEVDEGEAYDDQLVAVITAFQRHWRPAKVDGVVDWETQAVIIAVREAVRRLT